MKRKLAAVLIVCLMLSAIFWPDQTLLVFAVDSFDNDINYVEVWQWNGTSYVIRANFTSTSQSVRVEDGKALKFIVSIKFNATLASSESEAISYTRVYMNITDGGTIWNNVELNNTDCTLNGDFYWLKEEGIWNSTGYPVAGVIYQCGVSYQGYY